MHITDLCCIVNMQPGGNSTVSAGVSDAHALFPVLLILLYLLQVYTQMEEAVCFLTSRHA